MTLMDLMEVILWLEAKIASTKDGRRKAYEKTLNKINKITGRV